MVTKPASKTSIHVLVFPFPAQGHITGMLKLAHLLSLSGLHVTFLNTDYNNRRAASFSAAYTRLAVHPKFRFRSIPDGFPEDKPRSGSSMWEMVELLRTKGNASYHELLVSNNGSEESEWPPVTCVIVDCMMPFASDLAENLGIPAFSFRTVSASALWAYFCIPGLVHTGELPFSGADLDVLIQNVPGMEGFLRRRDLPSFCREVRDTGDHFLRGVAAIAAGASRTRGLIVNTIESLEVPVLAHIRSHYPTAYTLGPLSAILDEVTDHSSGVDDFSASLWEEDRTSIEWLDYQQERSVVYVSFGSMAVVSREQLLEFWHGLVNSGCRFLWVLRPGLTMADGEENQQMVMPPPELEAAVRERGFLVRWAPQKEVLSHPAVGCFLTHSGWNSTLESITAGVPMICWPFYADQQVNSRFVSEVWRVGLDMKDRCEREVVERMVREVMQGQAGKKLRQSAAEMAVMVQRSVEKGGSSRLNLDKLIDHIKSLSSSLQIR